MDGVGELESDGGQGESFRDIARVFDYDVRGIEELGKDVTNICFAKTVSAPKHPGGFKKDGFGDPDGPDCKRRLSSFELGPVVRDEEANEDVSIDRCHTFASLHDPLPLESACPLGRLVRAV